MTTVVADRGAMIALAVDATVVVVTAVVVADDVVWAKMKMMAEGAALASKRLWG